MLSCGLGTLAACLQLIASYHVANSNAAAECAGRTSAIRGVLGLNKEYKLFNNKATYDEAKEQCRAWGTNWKSTGRLASIPDMPTHTCLTKMIMTEGNYRPADWEGKSGNIGYLIGGTTNFTEWAWPEGDRINNQQQNKGFHKWGKNLPRKSDPGKRCMAMLLHGGQERGTWVEHPCNEVAFYICERDIPKRRAWGFNNNSHAAPPKKWTKVEKEYATCNGTRQSPVDVSVSRDLRTCKGHQEGNIVEWVNNTKVRWEIENTGRMIKITTKNPNSIYALFSGSEKRHFVDFMLLKWGTSRASGSEHTVGGIRHAGELQIFHHPVNVGEERHAISFMLQERESQPNENWVELLEHISKIQEPDTSHTMEAPVDNIMTLLSDSAPNERFPTAESITQVGVRYKGSLPHPPCTEDVVWTVYARPVTLSFSQFRGLRHIHMEGADENNHPRFMSGNWRPLQAPSSRPHCVV